MTYYVNDEAMFVGDSLFAPDAGSARCDFPEGSATVLYVSIQRILSYPPKTVLYLCHDYCPGGRDLVFKSTIEEEKKHNIHVGEGKSEADFIKFRTERDATLDMPKLIIPSIQMNINAGAMPAAESNGVSYLKTPLNQL